jgi:hypothetical protein
LRYSPSGTIGLPGRFLPPFPSTVDGRRPLALDVAPALVACATLAGRRFGPRVGGWLIGFPVVSRPGVAHLLGPALSGLFTPFPVATTVLVVFAHREAGPGGVVAVYRGFIPSLYSFACFCAAVSFGLERWSIPVAFCAALLVALLSQTVVLRLMGRR